MSLILGGPTLNREYINASLEASCDTDEDLIAFYNMYDGCAFE